MRVALVKNFLTLRECAALNDWVRLGIDQNYLDVGFSQGASTDKRLTTRMYGHRFQYPAAVLQVAQRVREFVGIADTDIIEGHGRNGIVVSCTFDGGYVYKHQDPKALDGRATLRCNVLTQTPEEGGDLYVGGRRIPVELGDLHCYLSSEHEHYVEPVRGAVPRILWMFGGYVDADAWNNEHIGADLGVS